MSKTYDAVLRVSRRNQRGGDSFLSPTQQRDAIEREAERLGIRIGQWLDETDSVSGKSTDRAGLNAAVERAVNGDTDGIIVAKLDRFARTVVGGLTVINKLKAAGKDLYACREGVIVGESSDATSNLLRNIFLSLAEWQLETLTEGWEAVRASHVARGIHTIEPYGYRKGADRRLVIEDSEAFIVRRMFDERAEGAGWVAIAEGLNADGVPVRERVNGDGETVSADGWALGRIKSIVESRVYLGEIASGEFVNTTAHEPIVSAELWNRANSRRKTTARRDGADYPLTGLLYCNECGVKMRGTTTHIRDRAYRAYKCRVNHPFGKCPAPANINADDIESAVMDVFARRFFGEQLIGEIDTSAVDAATEELRAAEHDLSTAAVDPLLMRLRTLSPAAYADGMDARMSRVERAREALNAARNDALGVEFPSDLESIWPMLPVDRQRDYLAQAFDLIAVERAPRGTSIDDRRFRIFGLGEAPAGIVGRRLNGPVPIAV